MLNLNDGSSRVPIILRVGIGSIVAPRFVDDVDL